MLEPNDMPPTWENDSSTGREPGASAESDGSASTASAEPAEQPSSTVDGAETPRRGTFLLGQRQSTAWSRLVAKGIDMLLVVAAFFLLSAVWGPLGVVVSALLAAFHDALGSGQSAGKKIIGLKVAEEATGLPVSFRDSFLRNFPFALFTAMAGLPGLWPFAWLIGVPVIGFEIYLLFALESGLRLGDVMGNTEVIEVVDAPAYPPEV